jgi:hypothetical protein
LRWHDVWPHGAGVTRNDSRADGGGGYVVEFLYFLCVLGGAVLAAFAVLRPRRDKSDPSEDV